MSSDSATGWTCSCTIRTKRSALADQALSADGLAIDDVRIDEPTLENTFVATLRNLGQEVHDEPFPGRRDHRGLRGQIAIGATNLTKQFGSFTAVKNVSIAGALRRNLRPAGRQRRGQNHHHQDALRPAPAHRRARCNWRASAAVCVPRKCGSRSATCRRNFRSTTTCRSPRTSNSSPAFTACPKTSAKRKMRWVIAFSGLEGKEDQLIGSLPQGWKQRVAFGAAILHEPSVLFLDEPTSGVDPLARRAFWTMINRLADAGTAILVTTHYLEEAEQCNRLGFMVAGELVTEGTPDRHQERGRPAICSSSSSTSRSARWIF